MEKVFLNDRLVDIDKACIQVTDGGFLYGAGVFETMRSHNGVVFCLKDHLDRLFFSAERLTLNNPYARPFITDAIDKLLKANELADARLRLTLTSGPLAAIDQTRKATLLISATKMQPYSQEYYDKGVQVALCPYRQNISDPTYGHKTTSYFSRMLALEWARQKRAAEALWFTTDNRLAEGCISNVFLVKNSVLYTPFIATPVLAGVARKTICQLAMANSIEFVEKDLDINDLLGADEVFLTNVIMLAMPVTAVDKHVVGDGKVGPMARKLKKSIDEFIKKTCNPKKNRKMKGEKI